MKFTVTIDFDDVPIEIDRSVIQDLLNDVFLDDYGFNKILTKEMLKLMYKNFEINKKEFPIHKAFEDLKEDPEQIIGYFGIEDQIYDEYYDDNLEYLKEEIQSNNRCNFKQQYEDATVNDEVFSDYSEFCSWRQHH